MATTPVPQVTALEGTTKVDDKMVFEPERLSYVSADAIAKQISEAVKQDVASKTVIIVDLATLGDFGNLQGCYLTLDAITAEYDALTSHGDATSKRLELVPHGEALGILNLAPLAAAAIPFVAPVAGMLSAALGVVSLFRQDVEYHGSATAVDGLAFGLALATHVKAATATKVYLPDLMVMRNTQSAADSLRGRVGKLEAAKAKAWHTATPLISRLVNLEAQVDDAVKKNDQAQVGQLSKGLSLMRRQLDPMLTALSRADQRLSDLQGQWGQSDKSGLSMLARLLRAEELLAMQGAVFLHAAVVSSGGHTRVSRNLFRTLFAGDGLEFMGGAVARWGLLAADGAIEKSGILSERSRSTFPKEGAQ